MIDISLCPSNMQTKGAAILELKSVTLTIPCEYVSDINS